MYIMYAHTMYMYNVHVHVYMYIYNNALGVMPCTCTRMMVIIMSFG